MPTELSSYFGKTYNNPSVYPQTHFSISLWLVEDTTNSSGSSLAFSTLNSDFLRDMFKFQHECWKQKTEPN